MTKSAGSWFVAAVPAALSVLITFGEASAKPWGGGASQLAREIDAATAGAAPSKPPTKTPTVPIEELRRVNGIPLALLSSSYLHVEESGVATIQPERWAALVFHPSGAAFLLVGRGEKYKGYEAKFSYRRGALSLRFASRGFARSVSFPLDLAAAEVAMPFQVFSAKKGNSTWKREGSADRLLDNVNYLCDAIVLARKLHPDTTTVLLARYLELFVHSAGASEIDVSPAPRILSMTSFRLKAGTLTVELEEPDWPDRVTGTFGSCFHRVSGDTGSSPCTGRESLICSQKGCRCSADDEIRLVPGKTTISGSCDRLRIEEVIGLHSNAVRHCFMAAPAAGKVAASFTVDSTGAVSETKLAGSTMNNSDLEQCIVKRIGPRPFPEFKGGGTCIVNYTFVFETSGWSEL